MQAVAYGTRHIIDTLEAAGHTVERVAVCGGGAKNSIWLQQHADALQRPLVLSQAEIPLPLPLPLPLPRPRPHPPVAVAGKS